MPTPTKKQVSVRSGAAVCGPEAQHHWSIAVCPVHKLYLSHPMVSPNSAKDRSPPGAGRGAFILPRNLLRRAAATAEHKTKRSHSFEPEQRTV